MRLNNREDLTPICATENVPLFVMYFKGELPEKHKSKLEAHLSQCADCKMNLAYVKEILQFKHSLSADEKTLLLKYLSDPLFYYFIHDIRKKVLSDVRDILKEANIQIKDNENTEAYKEGKERKINQSSKLSYQKPSYSYAVMTLAIAGFLSLGSLIVLGLSVKYPALQSYLPFSSSASPVVAETLPSNLNSDLSINLSKATENNLYKNLDTTIDEFLATQDRQHLAKAESIAKNIKLLYEDNYGVDLVSYYKSVPDSALDQLSICRKQLFELINLPPGDGYKQTLEKAQQLEKDLLKLGNIIEVYRTKTLISKSSVFLHKNALTSSITKEGLEFSVNNKYLFLQGYFLLWQAKELSIASDF
ncbi:MAG: zf-HC2 domain-containing protein, partial [Blastocatellia bacterium]